MPSFFFSLSFRVERPGSFCRTIFVRRVAQGGICFFSSRLRYQLQLNIADLHSRIILPVPARNLILIALLELEHSQFLRAPLADNLSRNSHLRRIRPKHHLLVVSMHREHGAKRHLFSHVSADPLNPYSVAGRDAILLPPGLNDGVHRSSTCKDKRRLYRLYTKPVNARNQWYTITLPDTQTIIRIYTKGARYPWRTLPLAHVTLKKSFPLFSLQIVTGRVS